MQELRPKSDESSARAMGRVGAGNGPTRIFRAQEQLFWDRVKALRSRLAEEFPGIFDLERPVPFKRGIIEDIIRARPTVVRPQLRKMLWWLTCRKAYLAGCKPGAPRYGLDMVQCGEVTEPEARYSALTLMQREANSVPKIERIEP